MAFANCQDAWVWKSPLFVQECDFMIGRLGCDNAIAERIKRSGYVPVNSPNQFKIYHFDVCRGKTCENQLEMQKPNPERPEEKGYYLVPDVDAIRSADQLMNALKLGPLHRYRVLCDIMTNHIAIDNSPEKMKEIQEKIKTETAAPTSEPTPAPTAPAPTTTATATLPPVPPTVSASVPVSTDANQVD